MYYILGQALQFIVSAFSKKHAGGRSFIIIYFKDLVYKSM